MITMIKNGFRSLVEIPEPDNYSPGLASYYAQVLEKGLMIMVVAFRCKGLRITRSQFDALFYRNTPLLAAGIKGM